METFFVLIVHNLFLSLTTSGNRHATIIVNNSATLTIKLYFIILINKISNNDHRYQHILRQHQCILITVPNSLITKPVDVTRLSDEAWLSSSAFSAVASPPPQGRAPLVGRGGSSVLLVAGEGAAAESKGAMLLATRGLDDRDRGTYNKFTRVIIQ